MKRGQSWPIFLKKLSTNLGNVTCSAYPIEQLDTINSSTGELNLRSALNLIVFGVRSQLKKPDFNIVTRFGTILALWQNLPSLWQIFVSLFIIWETNKPTLANLLHYWANFRCCKWKNIETQFNHLVSLLSTLLGATPWANVCNKF